MLATTEISASLNELDAYYKAESDPAKVLFFSKLALIELCGWTEEAMDQLVRDCANRCGLKPQHRSFIESVISRTYGFDYEKHFRQMMLHVVGLHVWHRLEAHLDQTKPAVLPSLIGSLAALKPMRDKSAHTHLVRTTPGATSAVNAPSFVIGEFQKISTGLQDVEGTLQFLGC